MMNKNHMLQFLLWVAITGMTVTAWSAEEIYKEDFSGKTNWTGTPSAEVSV